MNEITHEGKRFRLVERGANVGELVYITKCEDTPGIIGSVTECKASGEFNDNSIDIDILTNDEEYIFLDCDEDSYLVLEPLESEGSTESSPDVLDLLASLSRKIVSLESQLRDTQGNVEKLSQELANARHRLQKHEDRFAAVEDKVEMLTDDICELDERTQGLTVKHDFYFDKTSVMEFTVDMILHDLNGICEKLRKVGGGAK